MRNVYRAEAGDRELKLRGEGTKLDVKLFKRNDGGRKSYAWLTLSYAQAVEMREALDDWARETDRKREAYCTRCEHWCGEDACGHIQADDLVYDDGMCLAMPCPCFAEWHEDENEEAMIGGMMGYDDDGDI